MSLPRAIKNHFVTCSCHWCTTPFMVESSLQLYHLSCAFRLHWFPYGRPEGNIGIMGNIFMVNCTLNNSKVSSTSNIRYALEVTETKTTQTCSQCSACILSVQTRHCTTTTTATTTTITGTLKILYYYYYYYYY